MAQIDFPSDGQDVSSWQPLPEGQYDVKLLSYETTVSSKGNQQIKVVGEVADGESSGKRCTIWYSLLVQSTWKLKKLLTVLDIPYEGTTKVSFEGDDLIDRVCRYNVRQDIYNGKTNNKFDEIDVSPLDPYYNEIKGGGASNGAAEAPPEPEPEATPAPQQRRRRPRA